MTEKLAITDAHEGPVYVAAERALYFTTQRAGRRVDIMRRSLADGRISTVLADAAAANGMTLGPDGRRLTGAYALGPEAGEWLQQATVAIRGRVPLEVLIDTIQPFPTFSEIYLSALKSLLSTIAADRQPVAAAS